MNNFIKQVIEEKFASKAQQRFFYAKANEKGAPKKEKKKWGKWAKEFSDKTDFDKIPDKKEEEVDEIVDAEGNIARSKKPTNLATKGVTDNWTTDEVVKSGAGQLGKMGMSGIQNYRRFPMEGVELTKNDILEIAMPNALGFKDTMGKDEDYDEAKDHMEDELGLEDNEAEERLAQMGYDKNLPEDKVRLVENPKKFMEEYIESILTKKKDNDIVSKEEQTEEKEINPIVLKQLKSLKNSMNSNNLTTDDIIKHLNKDNE
jgi:hypothetical protein